MTDGWREATVRMPNPDGVTPGQMIAFLRSVFGDGPVLQLRHYTEEQAVIKVVEKMHRRADVLGECHMHQEASVVRNVARDIDPRFGRE
ncbi:hypothetical protein ACFW2V_13750 [Streptomyces sp. NPDC058947]|uniref:hypothetical protein n=1 Tax=Streptomyces sp. NPDC058947 TaxID=3346675 RepID=UPI0036B5318E